MVEEVIITGGAGFLGSHVAKLMLDIGYKVIIFDDFSNGKNMHLKGLKDNTKLFIIKGDLTKKQDIENLEKSFKNLSAIIHLAVLGLRQSIKDPHRVNEVIVNGTINVLDMALRKNIKLFLNCSSSEAYGTAEYVPMDEKHPLNPETPYAAAKVAQDMYVGSYGRTYGLPWLTVRPFNMYGPNSHWQGVRGELIPKMIVRAINKKPLIIFGEGNQTRDFLYVEDAAQGIATVLKNPKKVNTVINLCFGVETSVIKIATIICNYFNLDPEKYIIKQPPRPGDVLRHLGDNSKFFNLYKFKPRIKIEEGMAKTIDWFKSLPFEPEELLSQEIPRNWE